MTTEYQDIKHIMMAKKIDGNLITIGYRVSYFLFLSTIKPFHMLILVYSDSILASVHLQQSSSIVVGDGLSGLDRVYLFSELLIDVTLIKV